MTILPCRGSRARASWPDAGAALAAVVATVLILLSLAASSAFSADAPAVTVKMQDTPPFYVPDKVTIKAGQTVEWINDGETVHDICTKVSMAQRKSDVMLPKGAKPFDSGFLAPGKKWSHKFTVPGTYKYFCIPHELAGMIGYVIVKK